MTRTLGAQLLVIGYLIQNKHRVQIPMTTPLNDALILDKLADPKSMLFQGPVLLVNGFLTEPVEVWPRLQVYEIHRSAA